MGGSGEDGKDRMKGFLFVCLVGWLVWGFCCFVVVVVVDVVVVVVSFFLSFFVCHS